MKIFGFAILVQLLVVVLVPMSALCAHRIGIVIVCLQCNRHPTRVYLFLLAEDPRLNCYLGISRYIYIYIYTSRVL